MAEDENAQGSVQPLVKTAVAYTVATLGFRRSERRVLRRVLAISEHGAPTFRFFAATPRHYPQIVIVNGDSAEAIRKWRHFERSAQRKNVCAVFMSREPDAQRERYVLGRPAPAILLLSLLEHVAVEHHGFVRESDHVPAEIRVLAIVDSLPLRIQMKEALEPVGARLDFAGSGERALARIEAQRYALIFLDGGLCGEDAYDLCSRIRNHPREKRPCIVMLTGTSAPVERLKARLAGCDTCLVKPVGETLLRRIVTELQQAEE